MDEMTWYSGGCEWDVSSCCCDDGVGEFASGGVDVVVEDGVPVGFL